VDPALMFDRLDLPKATLAGQDWGRAGTPLTRRDRPGSLPGPVPVEHAAAASTARPQAGLQTVRRSDRLPNEHAQNWLIVRPDMPDAPAVLTRSESAMGSMSC
jgi:hypothetical protein